MRRATAQSVRISDKETLEWSSFEPDAPRKSSQDLERLAHWLDTMFEIPGIRLKFGIDALLGLLPGVGDTASALASVYILQAASKHGVPRVTLARMTLNIGIDLLVGAIPIVGDLFDVYWKANRKNVELLRRHFKATPMSASSVKRFDSLFVAGMIALIAFILLASVTGAYYLLSWALAVIFRIGALIWNNDRNALRRAKCRTRRSSMRLADERHPLRVVHPTSPKIAAALKTPHRRRRAKSRSNFATS